jgi:hypothetical protein
MNRQSQIFLLAVIAAIACSRESDIESGFVLAAPDTFVGASVLLDGKKIGDLQFLETHGSLFEAVLKKIYGDSIANHVVALKIDFAKMPIRAGEHQLRLEKVGKRSAAGTFVFPFKGDQVQVFFVNGTKIEAQNAAPANSSAAPDAAPYAGPALPRPAASELGRVRYHSCGGAAPVSGGSVRRRRWL